MGTDEVVPDAVLHAVHEIDVPDVGERPSGAPSAAPGGGVGDDSFHRCFTEAYPRLVRSVAAVCGDAELAADCVADAFERAYVRWWRIGRYDDPAAWVRRVALNRATDQHRRRARGRRAVQRLAVRDDLVDHVEPFDRVAESDPHLAEGLRALPDRQRTAMVLFYAEERSVAEVARAMSITEGAVKYHLHRGRAALRAHLGLDAPDAVVDEGGAS